MTLIEHDPALPIFVAGLRDAPLDRLISALRSAAGRGEADILGPDSATTSARPATHLCEIHAFGILGAGADIAHAAISWRRAALNVLGEIERAGGDPLRRYLDTVLTTEIAAAALQREVPVIEATALAAEALILRLGRTDPSAALVFLTHALHQLAGGASDRTDTQRAQGLAALIAAAQPGRAA